MDEHIKKKYPNDVNGHYRVREWTNVSSLIVSTIKRHFVLYINIGDIPVGLTGRDCHIIIHGKSSESQTFLDVGNRGLPEFSWNAFYEKFMTSLLALDDVSMSHKKSNFSLYMVSRVS